MTEYTENTLKIMVSGNLNNHLYILFILRDMNYILCILCRVLYIMHINKTVVPIFEPALRNANATNQFIKSKQNSQ